MGKKESLDRFDECYAPTCTNEPVTYGRRYKPTPIQVFPTSEIHAGPHPTLDPDRLETLLEEQNAELVVSFELEEHDDEILAVLEDFSLTGESGSEHTSPFEDEDSDYYAHDGAVFR